MERAYFVNTSNKIDVIMIDDENHFLELKRSSPTQWFASRIEAQASLTPSRRNRPYDELKQDKDYYSSQIEFVDKCMDDNLREMEELKRQMKNYKSELENLESQITEQFVLDEND